jgi:hypothetical protein
MKAAHPPLPPAKDPPPLGPAANLVLEAFSREEIDRGAKNVFASSGYLDFRDVESVKPFDDATDERVKRRLKISLRTGEELVLQVGARPAVRGKDGI